MFNPGGATQTGRFDHRGKQKESPEECQRMPASLHSTAAEANTSDSSSSEAFTQSRSLQTDTRGFSAHEATPMETTAKRLQGLSVDFQGVIGALRTSSSADSSGDYEGWDNPFGNRPPAATIETPYSQKIIGPPVLAPHHAHASSSTRQSSGVAMGGDGTSSSTAHQHQQFALPQAAGNAPDQNDRPIASGFSLFSVENPFFSGSRESLVKAFGNRSPASTAVLSSQKNVGSAALDVPSSGSCGALESLESQATQVVEKCPERRPPPGLDSHTQASSTGQRSGVMMDGFGTSSRTTQQQVESALQSSPHQAAGIAANHLTRAAVVSQNNAEARRYQGRCNPGNECPDLQTPAPAFGRGTFVYDSIFKQISRIDRLLAEKMPHRPQVPSRTTTGSVIPVGPRNLESFSMANAPSKNGHACDDGKHQPCLVGFPGDVQNDTVLQTAAEFEGTRHPIVGAQHRSPENKLLKYTHQRTEPSNSQPLMPGPSATAVRPESAATGVESPDLKLQEKWVDTVMTNPTDLHTGIGTGLGLPAHTQMTAEADVKNNGTVAETVPGQPISEEEEKKERQRRKKSEQRQRRRGRAAQQKGNSALRGESQPT